MRFFVPLLVLVTPALGIDPARIDAYVQSEMELSRIPGLSLAVVEGRRPVYLKAHGVRDLSSGKPMKPETLVELASLSKPLTALAIAKLVRSGRLALDHPAGRYLPGFASREITVRDLVRHASGLTRRHDFLVPCCGRPGAFDLSLAAGRLSQAAPTGPAGRHFDYANSNYVLLAAIVETVCAASFPECMESLVFHPMGMNRTTLDRSQAQAWGMAELHEPQWGRMRPSPAGFTGWYGASLVKSNAEDMARFLSATLESGVAGLSAPYDGGWSVEPRAEWLGGEAVIEHSGDVWGANTAALLAPKRDLGVVVLINAGVDRADAIARAVAALAAGLPAPAAASTAWAEVPDNWAMIFLVAAGMIFLWLTARLLRWRRLAVPRRTPAVVVRSVLLLTMVAYLIYLIVGAGGAPPLESMPATLQTALPLLVGAVVGLLLSAALPGLLARPRS